MKRRRLILLFVVVALVATGVLLYPRPPVVAPHIRMVSVSTNMSPAGLDWRVAVSKTSGRASFANWTLQFQQTNRSAVTGAAVVPLVKDTLMIQDHPESEDEEGILSPRYGMTWEEGAVYRVIGGYYKPSRAIQFLPEGMWRRYPFLLSWLPEPRPRFATSEWFEIKPLHRLSP
ncbi:MAG TPA: hypothetical protein VMF06_02855 [Candidatus Limnocylindria bacterium]|jgi:hypothetical protein|nr:hypothetical protein [Candidatus Limnocylindria bacterium]